MTIKNLRRLYQAQPFRPFAIHTADGRTFPVPHTEFLAYDSEGRTILALRNDGTFSILDLSLITELEVLPSEPAPASDRE
jgi:hypothetical protein